MLPTTPLFIVEPLNGQHEVLVFGCRGDRVARCAW
jgi:hypothetical protein